MSNAEGTADDEGRLAIVLPGVKPEDIAHLETHPVTSLQVGMNSDGHAVLGGLVEAGLHVRVEYGTR